MNIEKMALKAYPPGIYNYSRAIIGTEPPSVKLNTNEIKRAAFIKGANAVLEEIEAVLNKGNESRCDDFFTIAEITRKIEQLKK